MPLITVTDLFEVDAVITGRVPSFVSLLFIGRNRTTTWTDAMMKRKGRISRIFL